MTLYIYRGLLPVTSSLPQTSSQFVSNASTLHATYLSRTFADYSEQPRTMCMADIPAAREDLDINTT